MISSDVDERMCFIPGREIGVRFGAYGAQRAGYEVEDGADFELAFCFGKGVSFILGEEGRDGKGHVN